MAMSTKSKKVPAPKAGSQHKSTGGLLLSSLKTSGATPGTQVPRGGETGQMTDCKTGPDYGLSVKGMK